MKEKHASKHSEKKKKIPFSKLIIAYTMFFCTAVVIFICYEIHRLKDMTAIAYIGAGILTLMSTALGFYVYRAKRSDDFALELEKIKKEQELQKEINLSLTEDSDNSIPPLRYN